MQKSRYEEMKDFTLDEMAEFINCIIDEQIIDYFCVTGDCKICENEDYTCHVDIEELHELDMFEINKKRRLPKVKAFLMSPFEN